MYDRIDMHTGVSVPLPVGVVEVPLLVHARAAPPGAGEGEVARGELHDAVGGGGAGCLHGAGVVKVGHLQLAVHQDELARAEVEQRDRAQRRVCQVVQQPHQTQADLQREREQGVLGKTGALVYVPLGTTPGELVIIQLLH